MNLLLVESKAKARTIQKYLGDDFLVRACMGHVQDLPTDGKQGRKAWWASRDGDLPSPPWQWTEGSEELISELIEEAERKGIDRFYLATDPDREGEFIAWRLAEILEGRGEIHRITFQEITEEAVRKALETPRPIDPNLVDSARIRKFLDRLVGFRASKFSRSWFSGSSSMGRVQTPTLGFVVELELEREAFVPVPYFRVLADAEGVPYEVHFHEKDDPDAWIDEGSFHPDRTHDGELARSALEALESAGEVTVADVERGSYTRKPKPPFTTEALLGAAGSKLGWNPGRTMAVAGDLYNEGHVTYIRTDSTRTGEDARRRVQERIADRWGEDHLGSGAGGSDASGPVQDAHEAIRPSRPEVEAPEDLEASQERLYRLIWARFAASQMSPARYEKAVLTSRVDGFDRPLQGTVRWQVHAGWEAAYEGLRPPRPTTPPTDALDPGDVHRLDASEEDDENPRLIEDETKPPARYRQHTLIRKMREEGIGRPSTYAPTVEKLLARSYVEEEGRELVPTDKGRTLWTEVVPFYGPVDEVEEDLPDLPDGVDPDDLEIDVFYPDFTAGMETTLDGIEEGQQQAPDVWERFRDRFRAMHNVALERRRQRATKKQVALAESLLSGLEEEAQKELLAENDVGSLEELSGPEIGRLIDRLEEETGGSRPPSEKQLEYIETLAGEIGMTESEAAALVGASDYSELTGGSDGTASDLIEELLDRRPPTEKQLAFIQDLAEEAGLGEAEACGLVGEESYEALTGGQEGTASELIEVLKERGADG